MTEADIWTIDPWKIGKSMNASRGESFLAIERCDRCGAQAHVETRTHTQGMEQTGLLWCAHDYNERQFALLAAGARIVRDGRKSLIGA